MIEDIWEAVEKIERYVSGMDHDAFVGDEKTIDSVVRNLEIIGEAANRLPQNFRRQYPEIKWPQIIGLRHRIVHDYFNIDVEIVWQIIQTDLPVSNPGFRPPANPEKRSIKVCPTESYMKLKVVLEPSEEGGFTVYAPSLSSSTRFSPVGRNDQNCICVGEKGLFYLKRYPRFLGYIQQINHHGLQ